MTDNKQLNRWRAILGNETAECERGGENLDGLSSVLSFVYDHALDERGVRRGGGTEASKPNIPEWINEAKLILPQKGFDVAVKDAVRKYNLPEFLLDEQALSKVTPDNNLLRDILCLKGALKPSLLLKIRELVKTIAENLREKIKRELSPSIFGSRRSFERGYLKKLSLIDISKTIRLNLKTCDPAVKKLRPDKFIFRKNQKKHDTHRLILLADQSGSMASSVINTAVTASILYATGFMQMNTVLFDTAVVDVSELCGDVTEFLLSVQLGGGTNIGKALTYAQSLITEPKKTFVVLISDLQEGASYSAMYEAAKRIVSGGSKLLCLTALDYNLNVNYDEKAAQSLARLGAQVSNKTPGELSEWLVKNLNN